VSVTSTGSGDGVRAGSVAAPGRPDDRSEAGSGAPRGPGDQSGLAPFRARLDVIDDELVQLLGERFQICREVAIHKSEREIPMMQPARVDAVRARYLENATAADLPLDFTAELFDLIIAATCRAEDALMDGLAACRGGEPAYRRDAAA
jgi:chorismate mutase